MAKKRKKKGNSLGKGPLSFVASLLVIIAALLFAYLNPDLLDQTPDDTTLGESESATFTDTKEKLTVHYINVGQGDATLLVAPSGETVLIDAASGKNEDELVAYLSRVGVKTIDLLLFTHPHEDHIGGGDVVIENFEVKKILMPDYEMSTSVFERLITLIDRENIDFATTSHGETHQVGALTIEIYGPITMPKKDDANNASVFARVVYGKTSFFFSGDAEEKSEEQVVAQYGNSLKSTVYKVAHHGSNTSTSKAFLAAIDPDIAIISCGSGNEYGHPHAETLLLLSVNGIQTHRTDEDGTIVLISDGEKVA